MANLKNYKQVITHFNTKSNDIKNAFEDLPALIEEYDWGISISYVLSRIETARHVTLYCGIVKCHRAHAGITREVLDKEHLTRKRFRDLFKTVFGKSIDPGILSKLSSAESIRDKVAHGKELSQFQARQSLADALDFAELFNAHVYDIAGFRPFGELRGFRGRGEALSKETTHWVLRGMGILRSPQEAGALED